MVSSQWRMVLLLSRILIIQQWREYIEWEQIISRYLGVIIMEQAHLDHNSYDRLNLSAEPKLISQLSEREEIVFSCNILKYNDENKCQARIFLLTNIAVYNIIKTEGLIKSLMRKWMTIQNRFTIKRRVLLCQLYGVSLSNRSASNSFVLHVINEHDYHYKTVESKMILMKYLALEYYKFNKKPLNFYFRDQILLINYCTFKSHLKEKRDVKPKDSPSHLNEEDFDKIESVLGDYSLQYSFCAQSRPQFEQFKHVSVNGYRRQQKYYIIKYMDHKQFAQYISKYNLNLLKQHLQKQPQQPISSKQSNVGNSKQLANSNKQSDSNNKQSKQALNNGNNKQLISSKQDSRSNQNLITDQNHAAIITKLLVPSYCFANAEKILTITPFMAGGTLADLLRRKKSLSKDEAVFYLSQIILFAELMHARNMLYGNICLENIYIKSNGYLMFEGLEESIREHQQESLHYDVTGSPFYTPPECILCDGYDQSIDIWKIGNFMCYLQVSASVICRYLQMQCIGICAFAMYTGHYPFSHKNIKLLFRQILYKDQFSEKVPEFITKMLRKDPKQRMALGELRKCEQFSQVKWEQISDQFLRAPYIPDSSIWKQCLCDIVYLQVPEDKKQ